MRACLVAVAIAMPLIVGCRAVTVVSDSLFHNTTLVHPETTLVNAINDTNGENHVMATRITSGVSSFEHPVNTEMYSNGLASAFHSPDAVIFSFGTNDMNRVRNGTASYESVLEAFWTLVHQSVQAGAACIVVTEWSHKYRGDQGSEHPFNLTFTPLMDQWFADIAQEAGANEYLGFPYTLIIADVSDTVHGDLSRYIIDYIHPTHEGVLLMVDAVITALSNCPEGRWVYYEGILKDGMELRVPHHLQ